MTALPSQNYAQVNNRPDPLGVTVVDGGVNVAIFAENATAVDFCIRNAEALKPVGVYPTRPEEFGTGLSQVSKLALAMAFESMGNGIHLKDIATIQINS